MVELADMLHLYQPPPTSSIDVSIGLPDTEPTTPSLRLKNDYLEKIIDSEINLLTKNLVWKEDLSIFDNNNIWRDQMELDLPF